MFADRRSCDCVLLTLVVYLAVFSAARAQNEVELERISATTLAGHQIDVRAQNPNDFELDTTLDLEQGTAIATATTMALADHVFADVDNPNAAAEGYGYNTMRYRFPDKLI